MSRNQPENVYLGFRILIFLYTTLPTSRIRSIGIPGGFLARDFLQTMPLFNQ